MEADDPLRTVMKLNERLFRFATRDRDAKELYRTRGLDPANVLLEDERLPRPFRSTRLPQMRAALGLVNAAEPRELTKKFSDLAGHQVQRHPHHLPFTAELP